MLCNLFLITKGDTVKGSLRGAYYKKKKKKKTDRRDIQRNQGDLRFSKHFPPPAYGTLMLMLLLQQ